MKVYIVAACFENRIYFAWAYKSRSTALKDYYALKVDGNSMIDEGIFDGDIVIIKKQSVSENGQTVVAIIDDNKATLKKLYREKNRFRLEPRNPNMLQTSVLFGMWKTLKSH